MHSTCLEFCKNTHNIFNVVIVDVFLVSIDKKESVGFAIFMLIVLKQNIYYIYTMCCYL